jgi:hypothetical protein
MHSMNPSMVLPAPAMKRFPRLVVLPASSQLGVGQRSSHYVSLGSFLPAENLEGLSFQV